MSDDLHQGALFTNLSKQPGRTSRNFSHGILNSVSTNWYANLNTSMTYKEYEK